MNGNKQNAPEKYTSLEYMDPASGWSDDRIAMYFDAIEAFEDGDPKPLGRYIAQGYRIDAGIAQRLAWALMGGTSPIELLAKRIGPPGREKDRTAESARRMKYSIDLQIGIDAFKELKGSPRGQWEAVVIDIASRHGVGTTRVKGALAMVKQQLQGDQGDAPWIDLVTLSHELPSEFCSGRSG